MLRICCLLLLVLSAIGTVIAIVQQGPGQFNGGTFSFSVRNDSQGKLVTDLDLITGWVLDKGPCGSGCSKADVGQSTLTSRKAITNSNGVPLYFGNWTAEYRFNNTLTTRDLNAEIDISMTETVFAMNKMAKWEQELMHVTVALEPLNTDYFEDIYFEGQTWHHIDLQLPASYDWHMQAKIDSRIRSDTGKPNTSPSVLMKPFYRIKLDTIGKIHIAATDPDGDLIKCQLAVRAEGSEIAKEKIQGLTVYENCTITINASRHLNYHDDAWGAVAITVADYNRGTVHMGVETIDAYSTSLCKTAVQFLVQVLEELNTPVFVKPTADPNQHFILYAGTVWAQNIYAQASENTTISEFLVLGRQREVLNVSHIQDAPGQRVKFIEIKWKPKPQEVGNHIICITAIDDTGVDSDEDRCFTIEIKPDRFNHSSTPVPDRPYFIDLPAFEQTVHCLRDVTCVLPLYVKSTEDIDKITVTESYFKTTSCGPISKIQHNGMSVFESDLSFRDSVDGVKKICLIAHSVTGHESDKTCIQSKLDPPDPCATNPCVNGGLCMRSKMDPLAYACQCMSESYTGKNCGQHLKKCKIGRPCGPGQCFDTPPDDVFCMCTGTDYDGPFCSIKKDACQPNSCNANGICTTVNKIATCNCYERYIGPQCAKDNCNTTQAGILTCEPLCAKDPCNGHGVCVTGGKCVCSLGYSKNPNCTTATGDISSHNGVVGTKFIPPSPAKASSIQCYISHGMSLPCVFSVFMATSESSKPTIKIDRLSPELKKNSSVGMVSNVTYISGLNRLYTADVTVMGGTKDKDSYVCLKTETGFTSDRMCVQVIYAENPEEQIGTAEGKQKNAVYKFISPTPNGDSTLICYVNEECRTILYTNLNTQCEPVVTANKEVTVQPPVQHAGSCVTEISAKFTTVSNNDNIICFLSSVKPSSQRRCIIMKVYTRISNKCNANPCLNGGDCFLMSNDTTFCTCTDGYKGDHCEKGQCAYANNRCDFSAYCYTDGHTQQCICPLGTTGPLCRDRTTANVQGSKFTDTAVPVEVTCVVNRLCAVPVGISSNAQSSNAKPMFGFISPHVRTVGIATERSLTDTLKVSISVIPLEVGLKTVCVQTSVHNANDDEVCIKVKVTKDATSIYGFHDRPNFIQPSLPTNADVKCAAGESCHVLYHVTPGEGHDKECITVDFTKLPFKHGHLFDSCSHCIKGSGSKNCSIDASFIPPLSEVGTKHKVCLQAELTEAHLKGEERCFNVAIESRATLNVKKGCQTKKCSHGGFCDGHVSPPVCFCSSGFTGQNCETPISGGGTGPTKGSFINNFGVPKTLSCQVNAPCPVNFHLTGPSNSVPKLSLGYTSPALTVNKPPTTQRQSTTDFTGTTSVTSTKTGMHKVCVQTSKLGTVHDEVCVTVQVGGATAPLVDQNKPYFIDPTPTGGSTVVCKTSVTCYIELFFNKADKFGAGSGCPTLEDTSQTVLDGIHIFEPARRPHDCKTSIAYLPPAAAKDQMKTLCTQVVLPGKPGEKRCFKILVKDDVKTAVMSPCRGKVCKNGGKCVADFTTTSPTPVCICPHGYTGIECDPDTSTPKELLGTTGTSPTSKTPHFDGTSAIPKDIQCVKGEPCKIPIAYHGTHPPVVGYVDPHLAHSKPEILPGGRAVTEVTATTIGTHKMCLQTTADGTPDSENVDEVCVDVTVSPGPGTPVNQSIPHFVDGTVPDKSRVYCSLNANCHVPTYTKPNGTYCAPVKECPPGVIGIHVFETKIENGVCVTDTVYKTGASENNASLCISAGPGGEKRHVNIEVKNLTDFGPCQKVHCKNGGKCVAELSKANHTGVCICKKGFDGTTCTANISTPKELPGTTGTSSTSNTPHFDGTSAIPKEIHCEIGKPCKIPIAYHGINPPVLGYVDPRLSHGKPELLHGGVAVTEITAKTVGTHKICLQTTADGTPGSENVDEVCVDVKISSGSGNHVNQSKSHFIGGTVPDNSKVSCNINSNCHVPVYTKPATSGHCDPVSECLPGLKGVHVFETKLDNGMCITDTVYKTGTAAHSENLCISSGPGGEERHVDIEVKKFTSFGPCQTLHCKNGGKCIANPTALCVCTKGFEGNECATGITTTGNLPGVTGGPTSTQHTPHFDGKAAIPKQIICVKGEPCSIIIPYDGSKPPKFGYVDPFLTTGTPKVISGNAVSELTANSTGKHKVCLQTTVNGDADSENVDEICVELNVTPGPSTPPNQHKPHFGGEMIRDGSTVACNLNTSCRIPVYTEPGRNGTCADVSECAPGMTGVYVFGTRNDNGKCVTDAVIKTGASSTNSTICISSGPGGEERHINVGTKAFTAFGPCQTVHCKNGGTCVADLTGNGLGNTKCVCPPYVSGSHCDEVSPCKGKTCNNGECIVHKNGSSSTGVCACQKGFEGSDCKTTSVTPISLPGVQNGSTPTSNTPRFDGSIAVPKEIVCHTNMPCTIPIPYHGLATKPPIFGHTDPSITTTPLTVSGGPNPGPHTAVATLTTSTPGLHRVCLQTTLDGAQDGENIDEICVDVKVNATGPGPVSTDPTKPHFHNHLPEGSTVTCNLDTNCHIPVETTQTNGICATVAECSPTIQGVKVFQTKPENGKCLTDVVVRTGVTPQTNQQLCLSAGPGGDKRHVIVETKHVTGFGPCQTLHCKNNGKCDAKLSGAVCVCKANITGPTCGDVSPCKGKHCNNGECIVHKNGGSSTGVCACHKGFEGSDCKTTSVTPISLPGVQNGPTPTSNTPRFDGSIAVPKEIVCHTNIPCKIPIPYHGIAAKPPIFGHTDPGLTTTPLTVSGGPNSGPHTAVATVTTAIPGRHRVCLQTTQNGAQDGENIDEICVDVNVNATGPGPVSTDPTKPHFHNHLPEGSTVTCNLDTNCHIPVETTQTNGICDAVEECSPTIQGVKVFQTKPENGKCLTDVVVRTGVTPQTNQQLCLSAGPGGEKRHVIVETKKVTGFGPCQTLHCKNNGKCDAKLSGAVCVCKGNFTGTTCGGGSLKKAESSCDSPAVTKQARASAKSGLVSCWCTVKGKRVEIIKKNPSPPTKKTALAAAYGAGGMTGAMVIGAVIYIIINKVNQPKVHPR